MVLSLTAFPFGFSSSISLCFLTFFHSSLPLSWSHKTFFTGWWDLTLLYIPSLNLSFSLSYWPPLHALQIHWLCKRDTWFRDPSPVHMQEAHQSTTVSKQLNSFGMVISITSFFKLNLLPQFLEIFSVSVFFFRADISISGHDTSYFQWLFRWFALLV